MMKKSLILFNILGVTIIVAFAFHHLNKVSTQEIASFKPNEVKRMELYYNAKSERSSLDKGRWSDILSEVGKLKSTDLVCKGHKCKTYLDFTITLQDENTINFNFQTEPSLKGKMILSLSKPALMGSYHYGHYVGNDLFLKILNKDELTIQY